MKDSLKKILEGLVEGNVKTLEGCKSEIRRIVLFTSGRFTGDVREVLSYTENCFLSTQFKINHKEIRVKTIPGYRRNKDFQEGDYYIDVGAYLKPIHPELF